LRHLFTALALCAAASLASGCALRAGDGPVDPAGSPPEALPADSLETHIEKVRHLSARPAVKATTPAKLEQQDRELAAALLQLSLAPTGDHHRLVAERYRALGVPDAAYQHFSRAVAMNRRDARAHDGLARVWRDWGLPGLALGDAHRAVFYAPSSAAAYNTMGTVLQAIGQPEAARQAYERAAGLDPGAVYAVSNLCYLWFLRGEFDRAVTTCRSALAVDPTFTAARHNLALAHAGAGRFELARTEFMNGGEEALGLFNMGIVHMAGRNYATAADAFDAASRLDPLLNIARERAKQARRLERDAGREPIGDKK
jgi:Flp pilus assembly protein TadD